MKDFRISCVLPGLNEEDEIETTVKRYTDAIHLTERFQDYELILVNDGSRDQTGFIMDRLARENPKIRALHHHENKGLGSSYHEALPLCKFEFVLLGFGFVPHTTEVLQNLFKGIGTADVVSMTRPDL